MIVVFLKNRSEPEKHSLIHLLVLEYGLLNLIMFITWLIVKGFPWFFFPILGLALPISVFYLHNEYKEKRPWVYVTTICIDIALIVFVVWAFTESHFPWFFVIWVGLAAISVGSWWIKTEQYKQCIKKKIFPDPEMAPVEFEEEV